MVIEVDAGRRVGIVTMCQSIAIRYGVVGRRSDGNDFIGSDSKNHKAFDGRETGERTYGILSQQRDALRYVTMRIDYTTYIYGLLQSPDAQLRVNNRWTPICVSRSVADCSVRVCHPTTIRPLSLLG